VSTLLIKWPFFFEVAYFRYGPAPNNSDTAVNILVDVVQDQSGKTYKMDHYATRYPTNTVDIANFLVKLSGIS
jgi:S-adenosylmethionine synthetase